MTSVGPDMKINTDRLQTIMRISGWNVAQLAREMGMNQSAVSRLLKGQLGLGSASIAGLLIAIRKRFGQHVCFCGLFDVIDADGHVVNLGGETVNLGGDDNDARVAS